jgi:hypothetical protein
MIFAMGLLVFVSLFLDVLVLAGPFIMDKALSRPIKKRCQSIHPGMTQQAVLTEIKGPFAPNYQELDGSSLKFSASGEGVCIVEFDAQTTRISSVRYEPTKSSTSPWELKGDSRR